METFDPHSDETTGYHVFLMPRDEVAEELQILIGKLSEEYGGPIFPPHVTVLGRIQGDDETVLRNANVLAAGMEPFTLTLGELQSKDAYYKALFATIVEQYVMHALHDRAADNFAMEPDTSYEAHLSLLYGNYPEERKAQTRAELNIPEISFVADAIHVYRTPSSVDTWQKIGEFTIGRS